MKLMKKALLGLIVFSAWLLNPALSISGDSLSPDEAFNLNVKRIDEKTIQASWNIAKGFHLYKDQMSVSLSEQNGTELGKIIFPEGTKEHDKTLGDLIIYEGKLNVDIPVKKWGNGTTYLLFKYQGCEGKLRCYAPISKVVSVLPPGTGDSSPSISSPTLYSTGELLQKGNYFLIILSFFIFGIFLSLTPCVLPMVPILAGIILGQKDIRTLKAFVLSLIYVLGVAVTYTIAGIVTAMLGSSVQAIFQNFWVILACSLIFVFLSLSLFGLYELQLPSFLMNKLNMAANRTKGGSALGVFLMGVISSLVVSPCVSAPLAGALVYIASTGNIILGGTALFSLSLGMGVLLIIAGTAGGKLFLKTGGWMMAVKSALGVGMLAIAIWMLSRVVPDSVTRLLWAMLLIGTGLYMGALEPAGADRMKKFLKMIAFFILLAGAGIFLGFFINPKSSGTNPENSAPFSVKIKSDLFNVVVSEQELQVYIEKALKEKKPVMLDFYADWCTSCKEMEATTFQNPDIRQSLKSFIVVRADVTKSDKETESLMKKYNVFAPPYIVFLDPSGKQIKQVSIAGTASAEELLAQLNIILTVYSASSN